MQWLRPVVTLRKEVQIRGEKQDEYLKIVVIRGWEMR